MEMNELMIPSLPTADLDWYEANRQRVAAFGLLNAFEDRAERNRFRRIEKALNPVPAQVKAMAAVTLGDLPAGELGVTVPAARLADLPAGVREVAEEAARLWSATNQPVPFPGVAYGADQRTGKLTWWVSGDDFDPALAPALPPMFTANGRATRVVKEERPNGYRYQTAALRNVLYRLRRGAAVFAA